MTLKAELSGCNIPRRGVREVASTPALVSHGLSRVDADVLNLSVSGARVRTSKPLITGARIRFKLPMVEPLEAWVVWVNGTEAGCEFIQPLHPALVRVVLRTGK